MEILPSEYQSIELSRYEKMFVRHAISNDGYGFLLLNVNPSMLENESMNVVITSRGVVFFKFFEDFSEASLFGTTMQPYVQFVYPAAQKIISEKLLGNKSLSENGNKLKFPIRNKQYGRCDTPVSISEKKLAPIVWNAVQTQLALFADFEKVAGRLKDSGIQTQRQTDLQQEMLDVSEKLSGYQKKREQLYNDYVDGILSAGDYIELKGRFDAEYQEQSARLNQLSVELAKLNRMLSSENKWLANIRNIRKARKLTPEVAQAMIDHINVYKTGYAQHRLEIIFRFQEERDVLEAVYHELEGGEPQ